jgi:hypothetical protein
MKSWKFRYVLVLASVLGCALFAGSAAQAQEATAEPAQCMRAKQLWSEDFETGDYSHWTSSRYTSTLHRGGCFQSGFNTDRVNGGSRSHLSSIGCAAPSNHRLYGGLQFSGDQVVPRFTNTGTGIDAPHGIVVTFSSWIDSPGFGNGRWLSLFTTNNRCDYTDRVVTFGLEDDTNRTTPAHVLSTGGTVQDLPGRTALPLRQWVRTTVYLNYHAGEFRVWQDGVPQIHGTFRRNSNQICQMHWGLYASPRSNAITLFEDDMSVWKLEEPLASFDQEPLFGESLHACEA